MIHMTHTDQKSGAEFAAWLIYAKKWRTVVVENLPREKKEDP